MTNKYDSAEIYFKKIAPIFLTKESGSFYRRFADFHELNSDFEKAYDYRKKVLTYGKQNLEHNSYLGTKLVSAAKCALKTGLISESLDLYNNALAECVVYSNGEDVLLKKEDDYIECLIGLSEISCLKKDFKEALFKMKKAKKTIRDKFKKLRFQKDKLALLDSYENLLCLYFKYSDGLKIGPEKLLFLSEEARAFALLDEIQINKKLKKLLNEDQYSSYLALLEKINNLDNQIKSTYNSTAYLREDSIVALITRKNIFSIQLDSIISSRKDVFLSSSFDTSFVNYSESGGTIIEFFISDTSATVFVIDQDGINLKNFVLRQEHKNLINNYIAKISNKDSIRSPLFKESNALYRLLFKDIEGKLGKSITIIPHGLLSKIPFDALQKDNGSFLVEAYNISYAYSIRLLKETKQSYSNGLSVLAVAPGFTSKRKLNASKKETKSISRYFSNVTTLLGFEATKQRFISIAGDFDLIHIASHADINPYDDDYSYVAFAEKENKEEDEYLLYLKDLSSHDIKAKMIVLSACNTGLGTYHKGEGILSLARGFVSAGTSSIISTLWEVDDVSTSELMNSFYHNLSEGQTKSSALSNAKRTYIKKGFRTNPYYWAAFIGIGDMQAVTAPTRWPSFFVGLLLVLALFYFIKKTIFKA